MEKVAELASDYIASELGAWTLHLTQVTDLGNRTLRAICLLNATELLVALPNRIRFTGTEILDGTLFLYYDFNEWLKLLAESLPLAFRIVNSPVLISDPSFKPILEMVPFLINKKLARNLETIISSALSQESIKSPSELPEDLKIIAGSLILLLDRNVYSVDASTVLPYVSYFSRGKTSAKFLSDIKDLFEVSALPPQIDIGVLQEMDQIGVKLRLSAC